ncbi:MAG: hypothetical protein ING59_01670 [Burkholderiales bacterium]|jgi:hypothetical protein|nr:hypothetical protein [Burkholderiales bacterium]
MERVIVRTTLCDAPSDLGYWLSRPVEERIAAVEKLRSDAMAGRPDAEQRLQRVCRVTQLERG